MSTRPDERLPFRDLARQGARVTRRVSMTMLPRLTELAPPCGDLEAHLAFSRDADDRPRVSGDVAGTVLATCQRCLERFEHTLSARFDLRVVGEDALASDLADSVDVLVVDGDALSVAEIVEDELLLELPERLCTQQPCPHAPALSYPAEAGATDHDENPFQVLEVLKR